MLIFYRLLVNTGLGISTVENVHTVLLPRFSCHITRHTFCSRLCENETNVKVIQEVMGHKDIQTTLDIYAEVSNQKKREVFEQLNSKGVL